MIHSNDDYENKSGLKFSKMNPACGAMPETPPADRPLRGDAMSRPGDLDLRSAQKPANQSYHAVQPDLRMGTMLGMQDSAYNAYPRQGMFAQDYTSPQPRTNMTADRTPTTLESPYYTAGFLEGFIGSRMRVEFVLGTNGVLVDRSGRLVKVGASYIVLEPENTDDLLYADLYSIRFVTIFR